MLGMGACIHGHYTFKHAMSVVARCQGAKDIQTPEGILEVQLLEAANVPSMDWIGQSDPQVK